MGMPDGGGYKSAALAVEMYLWVCKACLRSCGRFVGVSVDSIDRHACYVNGRTKCLCGSGGGVCFLYDHDGIGVVLMQVMAGLGGRIPNYCHTVDRYSDFTLSAASLLCLVEYGARCVASHV